MNNTIKFLKSLPGKVVLGILVTGAVIAMILGLLAKGTALKAKELNLEALLKDAVSRFKVKENQDKIKELDKPVKKEDLETEPGKVVKFYKDRK